MLKVLDVDAEQVTEDTAIYVTSEEEERYLEGASKGEASLSTCRVIRREKGSGLHVRTFNITGVTEEMFKNALATCGIQDADVAAASPVPVSGTAALIGTAAAWSKMNGQALSAPVIFEAARELKVTSHIAEETGDPDKAVRLVASVKAAVAERVFINEADIVALVDAAADSMGISLTGESASHLTEVLEGFHDLRLDPELFYNL